MAKCRAAKTQGEVRWACTEERGHGGDHKARGLNLVVLRRWRR